MPDTLLIRSLSFVVFDFECAVIGFDVSRFFAIIADSVVPRLAPASLIYWRSGRTSSLVVRSVGQTLYYVGFICRVFCKRLPPSCFGQDCVRDFGVLHGGGWSITHGCDESFPWRGRLLMSNIALNSSSIVVPEPRFGSLNFRTHLGVSGPNWILSSASCTGAGLDISLSRRLSSHKYPTMSSKVRRMSKTIALWSTPTLTSASESWRRRFYPTSAIRSVCMLLEGFRSQSNLSDPWLWDSLASAPSVSVCKTLSVVNGYEL